MPAITPITTKEIKYIKVYALYFKIFFKIFLDTAPITPLIY